MRSSRPDTLGIDDDWILARRGPRNRVDPWRPYAYLVEQERTRDGVIDDVATIFLSNRECPFRCLMCDLWQHTTAESVPPGAISRQIEWALQRLGPANHIKLYNAGSFFDGRAIPRADWHRIAELVRHKRTVIVESHPRLVPAPVEEFVGMLEPQLEVAMGLETVDPEVLPRLNKRMTLADFESATERLVLAGADVRAFILLKTPFQTEEEGISWAQRSVEYAFSIGVTCCTVIPTRPGNGAMEALQAAGLFAPPKLTSLEMVLEHGIKLGLGRVFADLWDYERFFPCRECGPRRLDRLRAMNLQQAIVPRVECGCGH